MALPRILLGHSMGGALSLSYTLKHGDKLRGLILSGPAVALDGASACAVLAMEAHARKHRSGHLYLCQHSAGSGKSNTIAWLGHRLSVLRDAADRVGVGHAGGGDGPLGKRPEPSGIRFLAGRAHRCQRLQSHPPQPRVRRLSLGVLDRGEVAHLGAGRLANGHVVGVVVEELTQDDELETRGRSDVQTVKVDATVNGIALKNVGLMPTGTGGHMLSISAKLRKQLRNSLISELQ